VTKIAQMLHISMKTVHAHCARMRDRLGLRRSRELLREAIHWHEAGMIR
jgi:DNA-binding CsgD family transcriptional regulator